MEIRIAIHTTEPLTGTAAAENEEPRYFEGWLELLRALSALIGAEVPAGKSDRSLGATGDPEGK